jgi:hypothetical protein
MRHWINVTFGGARSGRRFVLRYTSPLSLVLIVIGLVLLVQVIAYAVKLPRDYYCPYEGRVLRIETRWYDRIAFEFSTWEHLIIETPDGKIIDRFTSKEQRAPNRIEAGDYVVKGKGFRSGVRPRDKETTQEILERWRRGIPPSATSAPSPPSCPNPSSPPGPPSALSPQSPPGPPSAEGN